MKTLTTFELLAGCGGGPERRLFDNNFDALRLMFSSMVVVFHAGLLSQVSPLLWTSHVSATFAVQAFFVVSGFLVTMSFERSSSVKSYFVKRIRRIAPGYITVVLVAGIALSSMSTMPAYEYFQNQEFWRYVAFNLALSNFSAPTLPGVFQSNFVTAVNGSLWTIKIEVAFYCLIPFIVILSRRFGARRVLPALFAVSILWKVAFDAAASLSHLDVFSKVGKQIPGQLSFFAGGAWAYYRTRGGKGINFWLAPAGVVLYAVHGPFWFEDITAPICVTAIVFWAAIAGPRLPRVALHGDFSYSVYLYHFPIIQSLVALGLFNRSTSAAVLTLTVLLGLTATASWQFIERPALHKRLAPARTDSP